MDQVLTRRNLGKLAAVAAAATSIGLSGVAKAAEAMGDDWFATIKMQHREIDRRLMAVKNASTHMARVAAFKSFAIYLTAHSVAEETSVYPAIAIKESDAAAKQLYHEQDDAEILVGRIENALAMDEDAQIGPMLDQLAMALHAHVDEEETQKFPALQSAADARLNARISTQFNATFNRAMS
jgi:hemerythrin superfamily protein